MMAESVRRYVSYLNSPHRLQRSSYISKPALRWTLPEGLGVQWADDEQQQDAVELDGDGRPVTPPPPLEVGLDDTQRNRDVAAAMNRC